MLRALRERDIQPDLVVGSSVGALNGCMMAADPLGAPERLEGIWDGLTWLGVSGGGSRLRALWNLVRTTTSVSHPAGLESSIRQWLAIDRFEDLKVPLGVVVTDARTGQPVTLSSGPLAPALQASAAVPGLFPPVRMDDHAYIDGGATANLPLRQAIGVGAGSLIALNATPALPRPWPPSGLLTALFTTSAAMIHSQRADDLSADGGRHPVLRLPQVTPSSLSSFDFRYTELLIEAGYRNALDALDARSRVDVRHRAGPTVVG
jgi:NTE family protein